MTDSLTPFDAHRRAQEAFASVLSNVKPEQLDDPTPCSDWTVRELIAHVVAGNLRTAQLDPVTPTDLDGLVKAQGESAAAAQARFEAPDGLTRVVELPIGAIPGSVFIQLRTADALTHAWDLAKATAQSTEIDPEVAERVLAFSQGLLRPELRGEGRPFGEAQPADGAASTADRVAAFLGRTVP